MVGVLGFYGSDGTNWIQQAAIKSEVDGTPGSNDMPGNLIFATTPDGNVDPVERMRITEDGKVGIGATIPNEQLHVNGNINIERNALCITLRAGEAISAGDVLTISTTADLYAVKTSSGGQENVIGIAVNSAAYEEAVRVAVSGMVQVTIDETITRGEYLETSSTNSNRVIGETSATTGCFGIALESNATGAGSKVWMAFLKTEVY